MCKISSKVARTVAFVVNGMAVANRSKILYYASILTIGASLRHIYYAGQMSQIVNITIFLYVNVLKML